MFTTVVFKDRVPCLAHAGESKPCAGCHIPDIVHFVQLWGGGRRRVVLAVVQDFLGSIGGLLSCGIGCQDCKDMGYTKTVARLH